jgi:hypothetical protein
VSGEQPAEVWGRPAALAVAKDGALLVANDTGGTIWRISYKGPPAEHASGPDGVAGGRAVITTAEAGGDSGIEPPAGLDQRSARIERGGPATFTGQL